MTAAYETYNTRYVWLICAVAALGGLLFGYDWVVIGGAKPFYESFFRLDSVKLVGWANSCALVGCLIGSVAAGSLSERWGRKKLLILAAFLFAVSSLLTGWASTFSWFVTWRILGGVAIGLAANVSPIYIAEVSPARWRGRLVSLNQLAIVVGILSAQIVNWRIAETVPEGVSAELLRQSWNVQFGWRWMFFAEILLWSKKSQSSSNRWMQWRFSRGIRWQSLQTWSRWPRPLNFSLARVRPQMRQK